MEDSQVAIENDDKHESVNGIDSEIFKEKNKKLEIEVAQCRFDYEENELKCEALTTQNQSLEDKI